MSENSMMDATPDSPIVPYPTAILCPLRRELAVCRRTFQLDEHDDNAPKKVFVSRRFGLPIYAIKSGLGVMKSRDAVKYAIETLGTTLIIATGSAGSLTDRFHIGDVIIIRKAMSYSIESPKKGNPIFEDMAESTLVDLHGGKAFKSVEAFIHDMKNYSVHISDVASGEVTVMNRALRNTINRTSGAEICDWETAAIIRTSREYDVPCLAFRTVTDYADERTLWHFNRYLGKSLSGLYEILLHFISDGWLKQIIQR